MVFLNNEKKTNPHFGPIKSIWCDSIHTICDKKFVNFYLKQIFSFYPTKKLNFLSRQELLLLVWFVLPIVLVMLFQENLSHKDFYELGRKMSLGVQHLHHHNFIHCDIALRNFLVSKCGTDVVISDFGLCYPGVTVCSVYCRAADTERSRQKSDLGYQFGSIETREICLLLKLPRHEHVVELLGFLLDAKPPDSDIRHLALILPVFDGGSLKNFVKVQSMLLTTLPF